ncbi:MAG: SNF2-related protein [Verrucomicrobia bacterium]|nr:SNF2-related protein [Verrucomicrobiota bacterium]
MPALSVTRMSRPVPGQRWISTSEPALGLGLVRAIAGDTVEVEYPAAEETRTYAFDSAPLVRVSFSPGDVIADRDGRQLTIERVSAHAGLLTYHGGGRELAETRLLDSLSFIRPERRLLAGLCDHPRDFDFRLEALAWNTRIRQAAARGFGGGRIDLLPHQLAIAAETAGRLHPRVLLADEVGLGKTIEACLILHRLHLTGRAARILILVPEPLIHQWFVELLRRFNLLFALFDEARCLSLEAHADGANPFLDSQLVLAATAFLTDMPGRAAQARAAGFDLLIVDEAHHLEWSPGVPSAAYAMVEALAVEIPALLLLTATPQQLGPAGHFARLRLLDPERYADLATFLAETRAYAPLAKAVAALKHGTLPANLATFTARSPRAADHLAALRAGDAAARPPLIAELIDLCGTGRVFFRNTRDHLTGFPARQPHLYPLDPGSSPYPWLAGLLRTLPANEKVLLITGSPAAASTAQEKLRAEIQLESALFHEDLSLLQRDRNAAWFADPDGARILLCSEIGSEGRNFQFARHLVLFGLPRDPELLEQRLGRLDRIGQSGTIHIHVPYGVDSRLELHARWLHQGLDAFSHPLKGATALAATLLPELDALADTSADTRKFAALLARSRVLKASVARELASGHDRLLELGAPAPHTIASLLDELRTADADRRFERFAVRLFDQLGLDVSDLCERSYHFHRGQRHSEAFAGLPPEGLAATFERKTALAREDLAFLTRDHPLFLGALEQILDSEFGNAAFAHWKTGQGKAVLLECAFVLEVLAPTRLHLDRFLPPTVLRVLVDHHGNPSKAAPPPAILLPGDSRRLVGQETFRRDLFPIMLAAARALATADAAAPTATARQLAADTLDAELARLTDLATRNPQVSAAALAALRALRDEALTALATPRLRLDSLRLIWRT